MKWVAVSLFAVGQVAGCGKQKPAGPPAPVVTMETPRATADGLITASEHRSPQIALSLLPPDERIRKHFDCPEDRLVKIVAARRAIAPKNLTEVPKDMKVEIGGFDKSGSSDQQLRVGDEFEGCIAKSLVDVHRSKIDLRVTRDGTTKFEEVTWTFLKFPDDGKWYYLK